VSEIEKLNSTAVPRTYYPNSGVTNLSRAFDVQSFQQRRVRDPLDDRLGLRNAAHLVNA
jgi:hypothetical protein